MDSVVLDAAIQGLTPNLAILTACVPPSLCLFFLSACWITIILIIFFYILSNVSCYPSCNSSCGDVFFQVKKLNSMIAEKKSALAPIIKELRSLRQRRAVSIPSKQHEENGRHFAQIFSVLYTTYDIQIPSNSNRLSLTVLLVDSQDLNGML